MNVLSLFDGISCGQVALNRASVEFNEYYASEIKKKAIQVAMNNHPKTIQVGDVSKLTRNGLPKIDLLIGGSPCQDFSPANINQMGLKGDKSKLFYEYLRLLKELRPKYFLLENVKMKKASEVMLNDYLEVKGMHINSDSVSFQKRPRIYWTNIPNVKPPKDRKINFQNFKDTDWGYCSKFKLNRTPSRERMWNNGNGLGTNTGGCSNVTNSEKIFCLTRKQDRCPNSGLVEFDDFCRYLTTRELELAQTLPVGYTAGLSRNQAEDVLGDGWTVDVIAHIFSYL